MMPPEVPEAVGPTVPASSETKPATTDIPDDIRRMLEAAYT
jgi:hypothetical protein